MKQKLKEIEFMTIGMLGGSFCPPTIAHLELSKKCIEEGLCDKVIWVPVNDAYKKDTNIAAKHRVEMVRLTLKDEENITYSLHEQGYDKMVYTYDSLKMLQKQYPNDKIIFIAGADKLPLKWFQREALLSEFGFILTNRGDIDCETIINQSPMLSKYKHNLHIINFDSNVSSTLARKEIVESGHTELVTSATMNYIRDNGLFAANNLW
jgi:nicotinate-nucleotide adenylyltransferase